MLKRFKKLNKKETYITTSEWLKVFKKFQADKFLIYAIANFSMIDKISTISTFEKTVNNSSGYYWLLTITIKDVIRILFSLKNCNMENIKDRVILKAIVYKKPPVKICDGYLYLRASYDNFKKLETIINNLIIEIDALHLPVIEEVYDKNKTTLILKETAYEQISKQTQLPNC